MIEPDTPIRGDALYVSWQTRKGLGYVAKASKEQTNADAVAEVVLAQWLKEKHPDIVAHMKAQYESDELFRKELKSKCA